jgi:hypothetical protein
MSSRNDPRPASGHHVDYEPLDERILVSEVTIPDFVLCEKPLSGVFDWFAAVDAALELLRAIHISLLLVEP